MTTDEATTDTTTKTATDTTMRTDAMGRTPGETTARSAVRTATSSRTPPEAERLRRWRMVLGADSADSTGYTLTGQDAAMDRALNVLYGVGAGKKPNGRAAGSRSAGLGASAPSVARWLGDIRTYFPSSVVQVMQRDAIDRLGLSALLLEPEMLEAVEPDVHLVGTLLSLGKAMPETTKETARAVVRKVVEDLERRLESRTRATLTGALDRSARISRPRHRDIDWDRTIRANLKNYLTLPEPDSATTAGTAEAARTAGAAGTPWAAGAAGTPEAAGTAEAAEAAGRTRAAGATPTTGTVVPERLIGYGRSSRSVKKDIILCVDQSGSMAASVVHASVFGAVLASMRTLATRLVVFDTAVVDLTEQLDDPVDVLFGTQLGGGTDINRALAYCQSRITRPADTVVVLISDLYEGGIRDEMLKRVAAMKASGVQFVTLLALSDEGAPAYDHEHAAALGALGAPAFACTPDLFPDVMAAAIERRPLPIPDKEYQP